MSGMIAIAAVESFADNIGWTLLHFTWQASIIGLIAGLALFFVRREAAHVRYAICCLGMTLLALAPVATAGYLVKNTPTPVVSIDYHLEALAPEIDARPTPSFDPSSDLSPPELSDASVTSPPAFVEGQRGWRMRLDATLQPWMHWIVGGWLVGVALLMCRLAGGLWRIRVWAQTASETNDALLDATFARLRKQLGVSPNVRVLESARVAVPMVIGCLRPAVLVPTSLLSGLTTVELESILAHELAHIRRHDYFVNLLQNLLETLLFFHPVIWWLSRQTRIEREHCCDELAIGACGDRPALAVALLKIEESRSVDRRMVAANGGALTGRIRRILQKDTVANDWPTAAATFLTLLVILAVVTISSARATDDLSSEPQTLTAIVDSDDQTDEKDQSDKKDDGDNANVFATRMNEVLRKDSETGIEKRVFAGIRMMAKDGRQVTQDMIYSNVFSYSFISQSIANKLGAEVLGEIDFLDHSPTKTERSGSQSDLVVSQVTEPVGDQIVQPYQDDPVWIPGHLGFYGMNKTKQHVFKIVRLSKLDLGIGPPLRDVNVLVLNDENSEFGVIGRDLTKRLSRESGQSVMFSAEGEMWLQKRSPASEQAAPKISGSGKASEPPVLRVVEQDGDEIQRAIINAKQQSDARRRYLLRVQDERMKVNGWRPQSWSTKFETIVSARTEVWSDTQFECGTVTINVPENTGLRAAMAGETVKLESKSDHTIVSVEGGHIDLIDQGGVIRARATPVNPKDRLIARVEVVSEESVLLITAVNESGASSSVRVRHSTETGAMQDDEVPHDGMRYKIETPKKFGDDLRMRLSIRENLDRLRKELGVAETDSDSAASTDKQKIMGLLATIAGKAEPNQAGGDSDADESWGPRAKTGDLRVRLSLLTQKPKVGEPLRLKLELKNFGDKPQAYDAQHYSAFRVLRVTNVATGNSDESLQMAYQTAGGEVPLAPGETVTLWEMQDATGLFMLDEGTYKIRVDAPAIRAATLPASNEVTVTIAAGRQTFPKRLMRALRKIAPEGWSVQVGWQQRVYLTYSSGKDKRDIATIQLWATKAPLTEAEGDDPAITTVGQESDAGHLHLRISDKASALWPDCHQVVTDAARKLLQD